MNAAARIALKLAALAVAASGCSSSPGPGGVGSIRVSVTAADVTSVGVSVTGPGISTAIGVELSRSGSEWTGTVGQVPAGADRAVMAEARDGGGVAVYRGTATGVTVQEGTTAAVVIVLQEVAPPPPYTNTAPRIDSVYASDLTPQPGARITLSVTASDPDPGAVLACEWTATAGSFAPAPALQETVEWTAPAVAGAQTITVRVTDEKGLSASLSFTVTVAVAVGSIGVNAAVNTWPVVTAMTATPTQAQVGGAVELTATAADADGDALALAWTSTCEGTFSAATGAASAFTPTAVPADNRCSVAVDVTDGRGGTARGSVGLWIGLDPVQPSQGDLGADLAVLSQRAIYFGHQSVGSNVLDGVATLLAANAGSEPRLVDTTSAASMGVGIWAESSNGTNTDPISKIDAFDATVRGGVGSVVGIAFFKFCYIDFDNNVPYFVSGGTPATLFASYRAELDALRALYPGVAFVHFTAPLRTDTSSNQRREAFNDLVRTTYGGVEPVFDLALLESTDPDGNRVVGTYGPALYAGYTTDGGHLNALGAQTVARALIGFLAAL